MDRMAPLCPKADLFDGPETHVLLSWNQAALPSRDHRLTASAPCRTSCWGTAQFNPGVKTLDDAPNSNAGCWGMPAGGGCGRWWQLFCRWQRGASMASQGYWPPVRRWIPRAGACCTALLRQAPCARLRCAIRFCHSPGTQQLRQCDPGRQLRSLHSSCGLTAFMQQGRDSLSVWRRTSAHLSLHPLICCSSHHPRCCWSGARCTTTSGTGTLWGPAVSRRCTSLRCFRTLAPSRSC